MSEADPDTKSPLASPAEPQPIPVEPVPTEVVPSTEPPANPMEGEDDAANARFTEHTADAPEPPRPEPTIVSEVMGAVRTVERIFEPRGIRDNNPGNLVHLEGNPWVGELTPDGRYCRFSAVVYGVRALALTLIHYESLHGLNTVRGIITRWAPPSENDTEAYITDVAARMNVTPDLVLNLRDARTLENLVKAIIHHENGEQPYTEDQLAPGISMALGHS